MLDEKELYDSSYFYHRIDSRRYIAYAQDAARIAHHFPGYASVLDIGSGTSEFAEHLNGTYYGYDLFATTAYHVLPSQKYDVVVFRGTLQHIYNPIETLLRAKSYVNIGLAILATPNTDSIGYLRWGTLPALDLQRNWIPFGRRMLENILRRLEFTDIQFEFPYGAPYAHPLRNLWNFVVGKPDAFPGNMMNCFARCKDG